MTLPTKTIFQFLFPASKRKKLQFWGILGAVLAIAVVIVILVCVEASSIVVARL